MADTINTQAHQQTPTPHPTLKTLDRLVGTWTASDPSGAGAIQGQTTFAWMEGGFFLIQHVAFGDATGIEIIGYDAESTSLTSHYFDTAGNIREYTYEIVDTTITLSIDMPRAKGQFIGEFSADGSMYTGTWDWTQDGVRMHYDAAMTRVPEN